MKTHIIDCTLPFDLCQTLNRASGEAYTTAMVAHWRLYRKQGIWLSEKKHSRVFTALKGDTILHSQSYQSAVQDFYEACKTAKAVKQTDTSARYPYRRKFYHTTTWKGQSITIEDGMMRLPLARGHDAVRISLPEYLQNLPLEAFSQVQLVFAPSTRKNHWHVTVDDGVIPQHSAMRKTMAIDLGEIHPAACANGEASTIISCRALRANSQHRNKKTADLSTLLSRCARGSRRWKKLTKSRKRLQYQHTKVQRDLLQKISRAVLQEAGDHWCPVAGRQAREFLIEGREQFRVGY